MLNGTNNVLLIVTRWSAWVGMFMLLGAVLATTSDVLARKLFGYTYLGTIDIVQLLVLSAAFLAIPYTFSTRGHVAVSILADKLRGRWCHSITLLAMVLAFLLMACFSWFGLHHAQMQAEYGDVSQTIGIAMIWYWVPLIYGCLLSTLVCLLMAVEALVQLVNGDGTSIHTSDAQ